MSTCTAYNHLSTFDMWLITKFGKNYGVIAVVLPVYLVETVLLGDDDVSESVVLVGPVVQRDMIVEFIV